MKKGLLALLILGLLTACSPSGGNPPDEGGIKIPTDVGEITSLEDAKKLAKNDSLQAYGVVAQFTYGYNKNTSSNAKVGLYLVDNTSSMYVYCGHDTINNVQIGQEVLVKGSIDAYISEQEASKGQEIGYLGAQQIKAESVTVYKDGNTELPKEAIPTKTINELATTDFRETDLSGTIYKVVSTVSYMDVSGTSVYYFNDPSLDNSLYTYSTIDGEDFQWVNPYVGKTNEWLIAVHSLRSKDEAWRIIPIKALDEVTITDADKGVFALNRTLNQFNDTYNSTTSIKLIDEDVQLKEEATIVYTVDTTNHTITTNNEGTFLNIDATKLGKFNINVTVTYKGDEYKGSRTLEVVEKEIFDGISCLAVQTQEEGITVKVKGVFVRKAANVEGIYIADETGFLAVYHTAAFVPEDYIIGEELVFEGEVTLDFTNSGSHPGYKRLMNARLISNDSTVYEWNKSLVSGDATVDDLKDGSDDRVFKVYKVQGVVKTNSTNFYSNKVLADPTNTSNTITLYCSSASQIAWLDQYEGQEHTFYVMVRDKKNSKLRIEILDLE